MGRIDGHKGSQVLIARIALHGSSSSGRLTKPWPRGAPTAKLARSLGVASGWSASGRRSERSF